MSVDGTFLGHLDLRQVLQAVKTYDGVFAAYSEAPFS
jgi:hypothetical protein